MKYLTIGMVFTILVLSCTATLASDNITGSYGYDIDSKIDAGCWLMVQKLPDDKIKFQLDCCRGAPSYNVGYISDIIALKGQAAVYENTELGSCKITFKFLKNKIVVSQPGTDCDSWGHAVYADGVYKLKSRKKPKFENLEDLR